MDEREREKQRRKRQRMLMMRRHRRRRRILLISMFVLLLIFIATLSACFKMCARNEETENQDEISRDIDESDGNSSVDDKITPTPTGSVSEQITLTTADIYKGDLILVNSMYEYHFNENVDEIQLTSLDTYNGGVIRTGKNDLMLAARIMEPLYDMIFDCNTALGVDNTGVTSAYRTKEYQESVYNQYVEEGGVEYAEAYVSYPGYSEHHTGLSLDMGIYYHDGSEGRFSGSNNAEWMDENCQEYGFIRRYKEDKTDITGINNEAWHFRYVGVPHAIYMNDNNLCLEEYIEYLRTNTSKEAPLTVNSSAGTFSIYSTKDTIIEKPKQEYTISGDNMDGYIVTVKGM